MGSGIQSGAPQASAAYQPPPSYGPTGAAGGPSGFPVQTPMGNAPQPNQKQGSPGGVSSGNQKQGIGAGLPTGNQKGGNSTGPGAGARFGMM